MLQSSVALPFVVVLLDPYILSTPVCSLSGHEPPPRSLTFMLLGTGGLGLFVPGMLVFMAYPSTLANSGWKKVPKLEYQAQVVVFQALTEELYLPCYLTQLLASLCSIGWFGI